MNDFVKSVINGLIERKPIERKKVSVCGSNGKERNVNIYSQVEYTIFHGLCLLTNGRFHSIYTFSFALVIFIHSIHQYPPVQNLLI